MADAEHIHKLAPKLRRLPNMCTFVQPRSSDHVESLVLGRSKWASLVAARAAIIHRLGSPSESMSLLTTLRLNGANAHHGTLTVAASESRGVRTAAERRREGAMAATRAAWGR